MQRRPLLLELAVPVLVLGLALAARAQQPSDITVPVTTAPNLAQTKLEVTRYYESGRYEQDLATSVAVARLYLESQVALEAELKQIRSAFPGAFPGDGNQPRKLALVLDVDETALSNWKQMKDADFGYEPKAWHEWVEKSEATAIKPVLELARYANEHGVTVFMITGRREYERKATDLNLRQVGYTDYETLILKPDAYKEPSVVPYKTAARQKITESGYQIVLNVGDQRTDLEGGYADKAVLLPNPFYGIP